MDTQYSGKLTGKMLYFMEQTDGAFDAANDCMAVPVERFKGFRANGTTTQLLMEFDPMLGYAAGDAAGTHDDTFVADSVLLTVTANKQKEVMADILNLIHGTHSDGFIVIADDSNSVYASENVTACAITITAEA
jgi:TATA-binding protein-associated factor Taf7